jgi:hypothetical protein
MVEKLDMSSYSEEENDSREIIVEKLLEASDEGLLQPIVEAIYKMKGKNGCSGSQDIFGWIPNPNISYRRLITGDRDASSTNSKRENSNLGLSRDLISGLGYQQKEKPREYIFKHFDEWENYIDHYRREYTHTYSITPYVWDHIQLKDNKIISRRPHKSSSEHSKGEGPQQKVGLQQSPTGAERSQNDAATPAFNQKDFPAQHQSTLEKLYAVAPDDGSSNIFQFGYNSYNSKYKLAPPKSATALPGWTKNSSQGMMNGECENTELPAEVLTSRNKSRENSAKESFSGRSSARTVNLSPTKIFTSANKQKSSSGDFRANKAFQKNPAISGSQISL